VRQPASPLPFVDAKRFEPLNEVTGDLVGAANVRVARNKLVGQVEHRNPSCLAVSAYPEHGLTGVSGNGAKCARHRVDVGRRATPEKGERDMEMARGQNADVGIGEGCRLPRRKERDDVTG
jgi:hypothetical protein